MQLSPSRVKNTYQAAPDRLDVSVSQRWRNLSFLFSNTVPDSDYSLVFFWFLNCSFESLSKINWNCHLYSFKKLYTKRRWTVLMFGFVKKNFSYIFFSFDAQHSKRQRTVLKASDVYKIFVLIIPK